MIKSRLKEGEEVDITPMIDIVFQLIIFFMVVMAIAVVYGVAIKFPPKTKNQNPNQKKEKRIVVYVQSDWIDAGHKMLREGTLKLLGEEIGLARSPDPRKWDAERKEGYDYLRYKMNELITKKGYKKDILIIQGDMKTYHGKILNVIDQGKAVDIDGFSLVPPQK